MCKNLMVQCAALAVALVCCDVALAQSAEPPVTMRIHGPRAGNTGVMITDGWSFKISADVENTVAFAQESSLSRSQALVYHDPDNCLDMRDYMFPRGSIEEGCAGEDESYIEFTVDSDQPGVLDQGGGLDARCGHLTDTKAIISAGPLDNKQNLFIGQLENPSEAPVLVPMGAYTGGVKNTPDITDPALDCFGYGADDDLKGLVIMADIGAARVVDWEGEDFPGISRIRNMAGLVDRVGYEFLDKKGRSAITATFEVNRGDLDPFAFFDASQTDPNVDFLMKIDDGPIQEMNYTGVPFTPFQILGEFLAATPLIEFKIRVVLVEGTAPDFIDDLDADGKFTINDLIAAGYTPLSNQAKLRVVAKSPEKASIALDYCTNRYSVIPKDLDMNGSFGFSCSTGGGRSGRRVFR